MIIGNLSKQEELYNLANTNNFVHSYIFSGIEGIGKKQIARQFAKKILCNTKQDNCICSSCLQFDNYSHMDYIEIMPDGNSVKIEQIRNMQDNIIQYPTVSKNKVILIDDANKMTVEAQNALLKTLEEPPEFVVILLICSDISKLLDTIKSRCVNIEFVSLTKEQLEQYFILNKDNLKQNIEFKDKDIENIKINYELLDGSILNLNRYLLNYDVFHNLEVIVDNFEKLSYSKYLELFDLVYSSKDVIDKILNYLNNLIFQKAKKTQNIKYTNCIFEIEQTKMRIKANANFDMSIDKLVFSIWEELGAKFSRG